MRNHSLLLPLFFCVPLLTALTARAVTPEGIVYESEAISTPKSAWRLNRGSSDHWMLWTTEPNIERKRSGHAVLVSPAVAKDRDTPDAGAPPLHSVVSDLKPGAYRVYVSPPGRPLAYSLDGQHWFRHEGGELLLGTFRITDGRFELWVDDRYAYPPGNPGGAYYDYLRFVPIPVGVMNVDRREAWKGLEYWLRQGNRGFSVAVHRTQLSGFALLMREAWLAAGQIGDHFTYTMDRDGTFYLGVEMLDGPQGSGQLVIARGNQELGCAMTGNPGGGSALFCLKQPLTLHRGDRLTFTCRHDPGQCIVDTLYFSTQPLVLPRPEFQHVEAWSPAPGEVDLCWTTSLPTRTLGVAWGSGRFDRKAEVAPALLRNHRVRLRGLDPQTTYQARIVAARGEEQMTSDPVRFRAAPPEPPATRPQTIELTLSEPTPLARHDWPTTIGVPFARGALAAAGDLSLLDPAGKRVPLQSELISRWPDGSVKWALVSFLADTDPASPARKYRLAAAGRPVAANSAEAGLLTVAETRDAWRLATPWIALDLDKHAPTLLQRVGFDPDGKGPIGDSQPLSTSASAANLQLTTGDGEQLTCGPLEPGSLTVESNGPVRAVVKWSGPLVNKAGKPSFAYLVRMTFWKGQPAVGLDVSICNDQPAPRFRAVRSLELRVPLAGTGGVRGAMEGEPLQPLADAAGLWLLQDKDNHFRRHDFRGTIDGQRAGGLAVAADAQARVTCVVRDFWQMYPRGLAIKPDGLHVQLLPPLSPDTYDDPDSRKWFSQLYAWFKEGNYLLRAGQLTRHELLVRYDRPAGRDDSSSLAAWAAEPLVPQMPAAYLCGTGVLGRPIFPRTVGVWDDYAHYLDASYQSHLNDRRRNRIYGWMNFGDWYGERDLNYGNNEYDLAWSLALEWMRSGDRRYLLRGVEMARHYSSVDTLYGRFADELNGLVWEHSFNHVGTERTPEDVHLDLGLAKVRAYLGQYGQSMLRGGVDRQGHVFQEGNWLCGALTGDRFLWDAAQRISTNQAEKLTANFDFTIERAGGWPLINAVAAYRHSGNPYYLNAARLMIERCLQRQDPASGGWLHWPPLYETGGVPTLGGKAFAVGMLSYGILRYLDEEPAARPEVRRMLVRGADWLINESWIPGKGFRYISNCEKYRHTGERGLTALLDAEIIAFAYEQTRDPKYLQFWREMMAGEFLGSTGGLGKSFTQAIRQTIFALDRVRAWGITQAPPRH
jgi:hypothetical protein